MATVLIVSTDDRVNILVGAFVEYAGHRPVFHNDPAELPQVAVDRHQPRLIIVDIDHPDGFSPAFIEYQREIGRPVVAFSASRLDEEVSAAALRLSVPYFSFPIKPEPFEHLLATAIGQP
jgi:DNA-binding NtrC family response regulator